MHAIFEVPSPEGVFKPKFAAYFRALGRKRPLLLLAFAPKAAGTFFRQAAMEALGGGRLIRFTHAQGGRDGTPYLPTFIAAYLDAQKPPSVGHLHMQALPANRHFIDMFGLKPVIMLRDIPDMLASYWDMLDTDPVARADGLNCPIPDDFVSLSREEKADFMTDVVAPWYMSYFATWKTFHDDAPRNRLRSPLRRIPGRSRRRALSCAPARGLRDTARQMRSRDRESLERSRRTSASTGASAAAAANISRPVTSKPSNACSRSTSNWRRGSGC